MNKRDVKTKEDVEHYYNKVRKIRFHDTVIIDNLVDIYDCLVNGKFDTYYVRGKLQCEEGRCRSLDDLLKIYKYYFRDKTIFDFKKEYEQLIEDYKNEYNFIKNLSWCPDIRKVNFQCKYGKCVLEEYFWRSGFKNCNLKLEDF